MTIEFTTEDKLEYQFNPVTSGALHFKVKAANDAHIALTAGPAEGDPMYEVGYVLFCAHLFLLSPFFQNVLVPELSQYTGAVHKLSKFTAN